MSDHLWLAPGKLNLFLHITGQRDDGYHELQTIFQFIGLADQLRLTVNQTGEIKLAHQLDNVKPEQDLCGRAAHLLQQTSGCRQGVDIELIKQLPIGGGIGGGSSDAATVLLVLNRLWNLDFSERELVALGLQLGADIPVFLHGHACWAEGVGEQWQDVDLAEPCYLVVHPGVHVATADVFAAADLTRNSPPITMRDFLAGQTGNDCEAVVRQLVPEVNEAMEWLSQFAQPQLTGTGACVFAVFESEEEAQLVADKCMNRWKCFVTQGYNRSPLHRQLEHI